MRFCALCCCGWKCSALLLGCITAILCRIAVVASEKVDNTWIQQSQLHYQHSRKEVTDISESPYLFGDINDICNQQSSVYDALNCWILNNVQLRLPDQSFSTPSVTVNVNDLVCSQLIASGLQSNVVERGSKDTANTQSPILQLELFNVSATCSATYQLSHGWIKAAGQLVMTIGVGSDVSARRATNNREEKELANSETMLSPAALSWSLAIHSRPLNDINTMLLPDSVETLSCQTVLAVTRLDFRGSISAYLADLVRGTIATYVSTQLNQQVCQTIHADTDTDNNQKEDVDTILTRYLRQAMLLLEPYLSNETKQETTITDIGTNSSITGWNNLWSSSILPSAIDRPIRRTRSNFISSSTSTANQSNGTDAIDGKKQRKIKSPDASPVVILDALTFINNYFDSYLNTGLLSHWFPHIHFDNDNHKGQCGFVMDRGINGFIHNTLLPTAGKLELLPGPQQLPTMQIPIAAIDTIVILDITVQSVIVTGVDHWQELQVFRPVKGEDQLETRLSSLVSNPDSLGVTLSFQIALSVPATLFRSNVHDPPNSTLILKDSFAFSVNATSLDAILRLDWQLHQEFYQNNLTMASVLDVLQDLIHGRRRNDQENNLFNQMYSEQLACILQSISSLQLSELAMRVQIASASILSKHENKKNELTTMNKKAKRLSSSLDEFDDLFNTVSRLALRQYGQLMSASIFGLLQNPARTALNQLLSNVISQQSSVDKNVSCPLLPLPTDNQSSSDSHWVNFSQLSPLLALNNFLDDPFTLKSINYFLDCEASTFGHLVRDMNLSLPLTVLLPPSQSSAGTGARISNLANSSLSLLPKLSVRQLDILHAGRVEHLQFGAPEGNNGTLLTSSLCYASNESQVRPQAIIGLDLDFSLQNTSYTLSLNISVFVEDIQVLLSSLIHYDGFRLQKESVAQLLSTFATCAAVPLYNVDFPAVQSNLRFGFVVNASLIHANESNVAPAHYNSVTIDSTNYPQIAVMADALLSWAVNSTRDVLSKVISSNKSIALTSNNDVCNPGAIPSRTNEAENKQKTYQDIRVVLFVIFFFALLCQPAILFLREEPKDTFDDGTGYQHLTEPFFLHGDNQPNIETDEMESHTARLSLVHRSKALMNDKVVSEIHRHSFPVFIFLTLALLLASNLTVGATVGVNIALDGREFSFPSLFVVGSIDTVKEMWNAGFYPFLILVAVFSGIWPQIKLILMFLVWIVEPTKMGGFDRNRLVLALDSLGKFSLVETFIFVIMMVVFHSHFEGSGILLDVFVSPRFGFYGFLAAIWVSLILGNVLVYHQQKSDMQRTQVANDSTVESVCTHTFRVSGRNYQLSRTFRVIFCMMWIITAVFLGIGMNQRSFLFEYGGLAGLALGETSRSMFSFLSIGIALPDSMIFSTAFLCPFLLQMAFFINVIVTPFCCLLSLILLFVYPLTFTQQIKVLSFAQIANAWSAVEVFTLSIIAVFLQIPSLVSLFVGNHFDFINEILEHFGNETLSDYQTDNATLSGTNEKFFEIRSVVIWKSASFLIVGVVLNSLWVFTALRLTRLVLKERHDHEIMALVDSNPDLRTDKITTTNESTKSLLDWLAFHGGGYTSWILVQSEDTSLSSNALIRESTDDVDPDP